MKKLLIAIVMFSISNLYSRCCPEQIIHSKGKREEDPVKLAKLCKLPQKVSSQTSLKSELINLQTILQKIESKNLARENRQLFNSAKVLLANLLRNGNLVK
jgi:hypothetical protein